jgi:hypothetical protein
LSGWGAGCPKPGPWVAPRDGGDELLEVPKAGGPVEVASADLMRALMHAGQDYRRYAFGGADADKVFVLDGDRLAGLPSAG